MKKIVGFDVDGTLVPEIPYSWEEFHRVFNIDRKRLDRILQDYLSGKITFEEWGIRDTALWIEKNLRKPDFVAAINENFRLANGTIELLNELKSKNYILAVISGSLSIVLETLLPDFNNIFSHVYIGHLTFNNNGLLSGFVSGNVLKNGNEDKLGELKIICKKEQVHLNNTVFIGDNTNDLEALKSAGLGIAFRPQSSRVTEASDVIIKENNLMKVLEYL
jgi:HAD superfamily phosphoserine phosphatase-like hydrolase